jgi:hypothetical protein
MFLGDLTRPRNIRTHLMNISYVHQFLSRVTYFSYEYRLEDHKKRGTNVFFLVVDRKIWEVGSVSHFKKLKIKLI